MDNEDNDTWPEVEATCRGCRSEWLWRRVQNNASDREAVGGHKWDCPDWETRQSVEAFIDLGEGTIKEVLGLAREKHWLRMNTKISDMLKQALAASRFVSRAEAGEAYTSEDELSDDEDEEDPELMSMTEEAGGVRDIAVNDWARNRILDGCWISPADQWYGYTNQNRAMVVPARHPCPWNRGSTYAGALEDGEADTTGEGGLEHPRPKTVRALCPPSFQLCDQVYRAFQRQMKDILLPAMQNIVRKLVIECTADGTDPAVKAAKKTAEEVVQELRDPAVWYNGYDWLAHRANLRRESERERRSKDEDDASSSSRSDGSHTTSPVLSTTTLQTTPSPPPSAKDDESVASPITGSAPTLPIPVSPVLKPPELLRPIPYIPVAISHLLPFSMEALMTPWREACSPLYHCRCSICERAILRENISNGNVVPTQAQLTTAPTVEQTARITEETVGIQIEDDNADFVEEEEEDGESEKDDDTSIPDSPSESISEIPTYPVTPRKRSSRELDDAFSDAAVEHNRPGSPPKRPRKDGAHSPSAVSVSPTPVRTRKRSSEELEEDESQPVQTGNGDAKRRRPSPPHLPRSSPAIIQKSNVAVS
ncbi:hypothetical protein B0H21DRAFT_824451 [Amylocystis lapponica]|nr:hypothetical protein B0H21DRAFT_824451 [Amylocystis lapponica]